MNSIEQKLNFTCPDCDQKFVVSQKHTGRRMRCSKCDSSFRIPGFTAFKSDDFTESHLNDSQDMNPLKSLIREAAKGYMELTKNGRSIEFTDFCTAMIKLRFHAKPNPQAESQLLALVDTLVGLRSLVVAVLTVEAGLLEKKPEAILMVMEVIDEELLKCGLSEKVIFGSETRDGRLAEQRVFPSGKTMEVYKWGDFYRKTEFVIFRGQLVRGRSCEMKMKSHVGTCFDCGCGEQHRFDEEETPTLREFPEMRFVIGCPNGVCLNYVKVTPSGKMETQFAGWGAEESSDVQAAPDELAPPEVENRGNVKDKRTDGLQETTTRFLLKESTLKGHRDSVESVAFSPDGKRIVSAGHDKTLKLWDAISGKELQTFKGHPGLLTFVKSVAFSPDGTRIVSGGSDSTLRLWDAISGKELQVMEIAPGIVFSVAFSPDSKRIISGIDDGTVMIWDAVSGCLIACLNAHTESGVLGTNGFIFSVAFSPDGKRFASGAGGKQLKIWDAVSGQNLLRLNAHTGFLGSLHNVTSVAFSPDSKRLVSGSSDKTLKLWDAISGKELQTFKGHTSTVNSVDFSLDGKRIVSGSSDKTLKLWDAISGKELQTFKGHSGYVSSVAFSPDGTRIVSGSNDKTVKIWDISDFKP